MSTYALKFTDRTGMTSARGFAWPLPRGKRPGRWVEATGPLVVCRNGIHAVRLDEGALGWLDERCWIIELDGEVLYDEQERKYVGRRGRLIRPVTTWDDRAQRLFALDCARHVLPIYEQAYPDDRRVRDCLRTVRRYVEGRATVEELTAARDAARAAAEAAWAAAWAAAEAAWAAAWAAAEAAARAAAAAARDAARAAEAAADDEAAAEAAWAAERRWQVRRLRRYIDAPEVTER